MRKSLADISWLVDEQTYRNDSALSYSRLSQFFKNDPKALISNEKVDTVSLRFGSTVDCIMTSPEEFDDRFYVADIDKFSATIRSIVEDINSYGGNWDELIHVPQDIWEEILDKYQYQTNWKYDTRVKKIVEQGEDYYTVLQYSTGKIVISPQEFSEAQQCVQTLKTHAWSYQIFECNEDEEILYQLKFKEDICGVKMRCMFDILKCNFKEKWIQPVDLKTTGFSVESFPKSFMEYCYWIQGSSYPSILELAILKDDYFKDFKILPFQFLVINKNSLSPLVWEMNYEEVFESIANKYDISWMTLLQDAHWHLQNGKFDYSRKSYENNGINPIILKL